MGIFCSILGHEPSEDVIHNAGYAFSRCKRCAVDLVEQGGGWTSAPRGFRIVWRDREPRADPTLELDASDLIPSEPEAAAVEAAYYPDEDVPQDRRRKGDRRRNRGADLPVYLAGRDRRKPVRDRRRGFGRASAEKDS